MLFLISPNAFKGALSAFDAAEAIKEGLEKSQLEGNFEVFPIADGGDGTMQLLIEKLHGEYIQAEVKGPLGNEVSVAFGYLPAKNTAVIEIAAASGLHLLKGKEKMPLLASTYGTGQLIRSALDLGVIEIILGLGGSATMDGGTGLLKALGVQFLDDAGKEVPEGAKGLIEIDKINIANLDTRLKSCAITVACDVDVPLLGKEGSSYIFGPQKGATLADIEAIEEGLHHYSSKVKEYLGLDFLSRPYMGAAGGTSAGLFAFLGAKLVNGLEHVLNVTNYRSYLEKASLVITGEGNFDKQTLRGKGPYGLAKIAKDYNVPVIVFAGAVSGDLRETENILAAFSIMNAPCPLEEAILNTKKNLTLTSEKIGNLLSLKLK